MGEVNAEVIVIDKILEHDNADSLEIVEVLDGYPCIIRKGDFKVGDKAIYVGVDAVVPMNDDRFSFLQKPRIKAMRLRGVFSMGILVPLKPEEEDIEVGQDVSELLGITRYQPKMGNQGSMLGKVGCGEPDPGYLIYYDLDGLLKYKRHFVNGEEVVMTEKIEGQNMRAVYVSKDDRLYVTSHGVYKKYNEDPDQQDSWWRAAIRYDLDNKLRKIPDFAIYCENYGEHSIYHYGHNVGQKECPDIAVFDILNIKSKQWLDYDEVVRICRDLDLPLAPEIYRGPWNSEWTVEDLMKWADGPSLICPEHNREGMVVRTTKERFELRVGRMVLKMKGETYLIGRKGKK